MVEINVFDSNFVGQLCSVALQTPQTMRYVHKRLDWSGITVFTDGWMYSPLVDDVQSRYKVGWLHEARSLHPENYERIGEVAHKFDAIMTHDAGLLAEGPPFVKTIRGGSWVQPDQWCMPLKQRNVAMILSDKATLPGHKLRHAIADAGLPIDLYGPSYTPISHDKSIAYHDYRYAVVVEACQEENFFSEHLLDAIAYGCVPLYWGCENISAYLPSPALLEFSDVSSLVHLLALATPMLYSRLRGALTRTQEDARQYIVTEDWQIANCLAPFVEALR